MKIRNVRKAHRKAINKRIAMTFYPRVGLQGLVLVLFLGLGVPPAAMGQTDSNFQTVNPATLEAAQTLPPPETNPIVLAEKAVDEARAALRQAMAAGGDVRGARRDLQAAIRQLNQIKGAADSEAEQPENTGETAESAAPAERNGKRPYQIMADEPPTALVPPVAPPTLSALPGTQLTATQTAVTETPVVVAPAARVVPPTVSALPETASEAAQAIVDGPAPISPKPTIEPPILPVPDQAGAEQTPMALDDPEPSEAASIVEPPSEAGTAPAKAKMREEKPSFFERLFGRGGEDKDEQQIAAAADESKSGTEDKKQPSLPIFEKLPPLTGPKIVKATPGEAEIAEEDEGRRLIVRQGGEITIKHDDNDRFRRNGEIVRVEQGKGGGTITTVKRRNGTEVITVRDLSGDILQRYRKNENGEIEMLIGARDGDGKPRSTPGVTVSDPPQRDIARSLPRLRVAIPRDQYVVGVQPATRSQIEQALMAPPVEPVERPYSLSEIRRSERLRAKLRRIDIDTVNFEFGATTIAEDQIPKLQALGNALAAIIADDPNEVFYIEGHTDAVGSILSNLALSDRRAESIAEILTFYFNIPPENLITQGYGEQYLKVLTADPERQNRRASVRRITALLVGKPLAAAQ